MKKILQKNGFLLDSAKVEKLEEREDIVCEEKDSKNENVVDSSVDFLVEMNEFSVENNEFSVDDIVFCVVAVVVGSKLYKFFNFFQSFNFFFLLLMNNEYHNLHSYHMILQ